MPFPGYIKCMKHLTTMANELLITSWKIFYKQLLPVKGNRYSVLSNLKLLLEKLEPYVQKLRDDTPFSSFNFSLLNSETNTFLNENFTVPLVKQYNTALPLPAQPLASTGNQSADSLWNALNLVKSIVRKHPEKKVHEYNYKFNFLKKIYDCLKNHGLHPEIENRDPLKFKRYNVVIEYTLDKKKSLVECLVLLPYNKLQASFLIPYLSEKSILINGIRILPRRITRLTVTTTLKTIPAS